MASTSETGHYIRVANLHLLNTHISSFGSPNAPTKESISLPNLIVMQLQGETHITQVQTAKNNWSIAVDHRQEVFKAIKKFSTRIVGGLSGTNVNQKLIEDAKVIQAKIQTSTAGRTKPKLPPLQDGQTSETNSISTSRQSYSSLYENYTDLVNLLSNADGYDVTGTDLSLDYLQQYAAELLEANKEVARAAVEVNTTRIARNKFLYKPQAGLVDTAIDAKAYIKGLFGANSPEYKSVSNISFHNSNK